MKCRVSFEVNLADESTQTLQKFFPGVKSVRIYKGKGCDLCHQTGYLGREGIFEVLIVDDEARAAIVAKKDASEIKKIAVKNGMRSIFENGIEKVREGITTIDEVIRVIKE